MTTEIRTTDARARVVLPKSFANTTVSVEQVSATELRICRTNVNAEDELPFVEESARSLSDQDRDRFLDLLSKPPAANRALKKAAKRYRGR